MATSMNSFDASPMGMFVKSPLGARNTSAPPLTCAEIKVSCGFNRSIRILIAGGSARCSYSEWNGERILNDFGGCSWSASVANLSFSIAMAVSGANLDWSAGLSNSITGFTLIYRNTSPVVPCATGFFTTISGCESPIGKVFGSPGCNGPHSCGPVPFGPGIIPTITVLGFV